VYITGDQSGNNHYYTYIRTATEFRNSLMSFGGNYITLSFQIYYKSFLTFLLHQICYIICIAKSMTKLQLEKIKAVCNLERRGTRELRLRHLGVDAFSSLNFVRMCSLSEKWVKSYCSTFRCYLAKFIQSYIN
jgi:hypothetical protein